MYDALPYLHCNLGLVFWVYRIHYRTLSFEALTLSFNNRIGNRIGYISNLAVQKFETFDLNVFSNLIYSSTAFPWPASTLSLELLTLCILLLYHSTKMTFNIQQKFFVLYYSFEISSAFSLYHMAYICKETKGEL